VKVLTLKEESTLHKLALRPGTIHKVT